MLHQTLNGNWKMREAAGGEYLDAVVPGSVMSALLENGRIGDPFWRLNEYEARELFRKDYEFYRNFNVTEELFRQEKIELICYGLDTIAEVYLNDTLLAKTNNMHRTWRFSCKPLLKTGENRIRILFKAPITYIESYQPEQGKEMQYVATGAIAGNQYIRKAHCMFGWDWGAQIPDAGIWRDIELIAYSDVKLEEVRIRQKHEEKSVRLIVNTKLQLIAGAAEKNYTLEYSLISPDGNTVSFSNKAGGENTSFSIDIEHPELWWPNGYGEQPLYQLMVNVLSDGRICDSKGFTLGLRTLTVSQEKDEWGSEFAFMVNGVKIFAKGGDYIPEDTVYSNITPEKIEHLIRSCARANYNCLRVWGGGYYPSDVFYELCDRYGLIVWQDLMFACNIYEFTQEFEDNIVEEIRDNIRRIRHHACLGLWCGNNEIETGWEHWNIFQGVNPKLKADYIKQFEYVIPKTVREEDDITFFWPSSPSSGGCFDDSNDENRGDVHYWEVWHGLLPFEDYRRHYFRFCSEFGFQSFPSVKTVNTFTLPEDRNIFTKVMESHQKNGTANGKIIYYLSENFLYPKDFESLLYVTQLLQGIAIKFGVEHWRRNRGRCMGALYWQTNDSWPVASWASVDYYGRWKALHYMAKNFFAQVACSLNRTGSVVETYIENENRTDEKCKVVISLKTMDFKVLYQESHELIVPALSAVKAAEKDYSGLIKGREDEVFVDAVISDEAGNTSTETEIFVRYKH